MMQHCLVILVSDRKGYCETRVVRPFAYVSGKELTRGCGRLVASVRKLLLGVERSSEINLEKRVKLF